MRPRDRVNNHSLLLLLSIPAALAALTDLTALATGNTEIPSILRAASTRLRDGVSDPSLVSLLQNVLTQVLDLEISDTEI
jgi:hypothetical protein